MEGVETRADTAKYQVIVITREQGPNLGYYPNKQGPVIDAVKKALQQLDAEFLSGEYQRAPLVWPPIYIVTIEATPVDVDAFKEKLTEIWPSITVEEQRVPRADIQVEDIRDQ